MSRTSATPALNTAIRRLVLVIGTDTLLCLLAFEYFRRRFGISPLLFAVHVPLVVAVLAFSLLLGSPLLLNRRLRAHSWTPYLFSAFPAVAVASLIFLAMANVASNLWMGNNVTYKLVRLWASDWWWNGGVIGLSRSLLWVPIGVVAVLVVLHLMVAPWLQRGMDASLELVRSAGAGRRTLARLALLAVVAAYGVFFYELSRWTPQSDLLSSDPILALLRANLDIADDRRLAQLAQLRVEGAECRASYPRGLSFDRKSVVIITVDALRADHTSVYGYQRRTTPFLSELVDKGAMRKVDFATSTCSESGCGILSTLNSRTLRNQVTQNFKLFELLGDQGYKSYLILSANHDFQGLAEKYGTDYTLFFDGRSSKRYGKWDDRLLLEGLEQVPDHQAPAFFYFHLASAHLLGEKQDRYKTFHPSNMVNDLNKLLRGEYDREVVTNNYDNGVLQADDIIRQLFAALDRKGYFDNTLVVVTADHGEMLGDRGPRQFGHVTSLYQESIRIPMLIYDTSFSQYQNLEFATQIDIAPTIVERLGLPVPACWEGHSLMRPLTTEFTGHQTTLATPCYAVIDRSTDRMYKYLACGHGRREELYDLTHDPHEQHDLMAGADPALVGRLRDRLRLWRGE